MGRGGTEVWKVEVSAENGKCSRKCPEVCNLYQSEGAWGSAWKSNPLTPSLCARASRGARRGGVATEPMSAASLHRKKQNKMKDAEFYQSLTYHQSLCFSPLFKCFHHHSLPFFFIFDFYRAIKEWLQRKHFALLECSGGTTWESVPLSSDEKCLWKFIKLHSLRRAVWHFCFTDVPASPAFTIPVNYCSALKPSLATFPFLCVVSLCCCCCFCLRWGFF